MISKFKNNDIIEFIQENIKSDPSEIVLKGSKNLELPIREIALQIESRQKGMKKIPEWVNNKQLVFPAKIFRTSFITKNSRIKQHYIMVTLLSI